MPRERDMKSRLLVAFIVSMLFLSLGAGIPLARAEPKTLIEVRPPFIEFGSPAGEPYLPPPPRFTVEVWIVDVALLYGFDIKFRWNVTYLSYVKHKHYVGVVPPGVLYPPILPVKDEVYPAEGWYWCVFTSMYPAPPFTGTGKVFEMTFDVIKQHWEYEIPPIDVVNYVDIYLNFIATDLADIDAKAIPHVAVPATVRLWERKFIPPPLPQLEPVPKVIKDLPLSTKFGWDIWIVGLDPYYDLAGFDVTVNFNATLVHAIDIIEGPYLSLAKKVETFEVLKVINNTIGIARYALVQLPPRVTPPPQGVLFTVVFHVIFEAEVYPPPSFELTIYPSNLALWPHPEIPTWPYLGKPYSVPLPHYVKPALYVAKFVPIGRFIDLYSGDFPDPFRGVGPHFKCEGYPPQAMVNLTAFVTYNRWPVQYKLVSFEIRDPLNRTVAVRVAFTGVDGAARISYRLMWPCEKWPEMLGVWTVVATTDLYGVVINDTLRFMCWWPLELLNVTAVKAPYEPGEMMEFLVWMRTHFIMTYTAVVVVTVYDEVGQPIGHSLIEMTYGWADPDKWCEWRYYDKTFYIPIPKWACPGKTVAYVVALDKLPWQGGRPLSPEISVTFSILMPPAPTPPP